MFNTPLLADVAEWIVPVVVVTIYVISHLWNTIKGGKQQAPQRRPQTERPLTPQPGDGRKASEKSVAEQATGKGQLNAEIDQFLKRASERRSEKGGRQHSGGQQPNRQTPPKAPLPSQKSAAKPPSAVTPQRRGFDTVAESVQQHLGDRTFEQREKRLAEDVTRAEQQLSERVEQTFGNRLGTLGPVESSAPQPVETAAADPSAMARAVAGLLINQQSLRQAVLLKEILERPTERW